MHGGGLRSGELMLLQYTPNTYTQHTNISVFNNALEFLHTLLQLLRRVLRLAQVLCRVCIKIVVVTSQYYQHLSYPGIHIYALSHGALWLTPGPVSAYRHSVREK